MCVELEILNDGGEWVKKEVCIEHAVNLLTYRDALGRLYARIPEGSDYHLETLMKQAKNDGDCDCHKKKGAEQKE